MIFKHERPASTLTHQKRIGHRREHSQADLQKNAIGSSERKQSLTPHLTRHFSGRHPRPILRCLENDLHR